MADFTPAEVPPRWRAGIEALDLEPAVRDIIFIVFHSGVCRVEIWSLRWERIDLGRCILRIDDTKTREPLELPITRQFAAILQRRIEETGNSDAPAEGWVVPSSRSGWAT